MSDEITPQKMFEALVKANGGKVISSKVYSHIYGPITRVNKNLIPDSVRLRLDENGNLITEIEGSEECIDNIVRNLVEGDATEEIENE